MGFPRLKRLKPFLFTFPLSPPVCLCATIYTSNSCNFIAFGNFIWWVPHKLCGTKLNSNKYAKPNLELICHFLYFALVFLSSTLTTFVQYSTDIYIYINSICRQSCFDLWGLISATQSDLKTGICQPLSEQLTHLTLTSSGTYFWIPECSNSKERAMHNAKRY